jgi:SanA protein
VIVNASGKTFDDVDNVPHREYGLLLATSPITPTGAHNFYFDNRIKATDELYKAGKVDYIIASGGDILRK